LQTMKISRAEIGHLKTYRDMLVQKKRQYSDIDDRRQASKNNVDSIQIKLEPIDVSFTGRMREIIGGTLFAKKK
ncbi:unnamed protein product, partial [Rotaria magnacalcarata]